MSYVRPLFAILLLVAGSQAIARDRIQIVGAPAVLAYAQPVAEQFARHWNKPTPSLEVTGTGAGFQLFCAGVGFERPDIVVAARPMTETERKMCATHGVTRITAFEFGRDAAVFIGVSKKPKISLTRRQVFAALAAEVPSDGEIVKNDTARWIDVDPTLPAEEILVMAPEPNTSAAIAFVDALVEGCRTFPTIVGLKNAEHERVCRSLRRDDHVVNGVKLETQVLAWLERNPHAYAVTSYTAYEQLANRAAVNLIDGIEPTDETIGNGSYPLVSGVYLYVKDQHAKAIPELQQFTYELTSERALGPHGYIAELGMVPLDDIGRNRARDAAFRFGM